jgi:hypothetical protein
MVVRITAWIYTPNRKRQVMQLNDMPSADGKSHTGDIAQFPEVAGPTVVAKLLEDVTVRLFVVACPEHLTNQ